MNPAASFRPPRDGANVYIASSIVALIISILSIALRFWSRFISKAPVQWDDWTALAALPFAIAVVALTFLAVGDGIAKPINAQPSEEKLVQFAKRFVYMNIVYDFGITFVKLSALFFYFRVFGRAIRIFRIALQITGVCCVLWLLLTMMTEIFMCSLFGPFWLLGPRSSNVQCLPPYGLMIGTSSVNVLLDAIILVLPHFLLWKLQLNIWKKIGLVITFVCGYSVLAMSLYRLLSIVLGNAAMANQGLTIAYVLEIPIAILSVCLPAIVQLGKRWTGTGFVSLFKSENAPTGPPPQDRGEDIEMQKGFHRIHERSSFSAK